MVDLFLCIVGIAIMAYIFRFDYGYFFNENVNFKYELEEFTLNQKVEDFEKWYNNIICSVPFLNEVEKQYGINFASRKEYYLSEIKKAKTNVEFYGVMKAISKDVVSFHTDVCFPMYSNLRELNCYNSDEILSQIGTKSKMDAWWNEFAQAFEEYKEVNWFNVTYIDGKYMVKEATLKNEYKNMQGYELIKINDDEAEKYIVDKISIYSIHYDYSLDKAYREAYTFNDSVGEPVQVVWKNENGEQIKQELFLNINIELMASYGYLFGKEYDYYNSVSEPSIIMESDDENELEYIKINNFTNNSGKKLKSYIKETTYEKIVIDLRDNYGGQIKYAMKYLYPALYHENTSFIYSWKVPNTIGNKKVTNRFFNKIAYLIDKDEKFYFYEKILEFVGEAEDNKEIYYLVGPDTGSAADTYISMIKEKGLGIIVGANTGGEGMGESYVCDKMGNSSLVYIYYPSMPVQDKTNLCCGTEPDIYINQTYEDYILQEKCKVEGVAMQYDSRIQYDTVLKWIIRQEQKE